MKIYFLELINGGLKKKIRAVLNVRVGTNGLIFDAIQNKKISIHENSILLYNL